MIRCRDCIGIHDEHEPVGILLGDGSEQPVLGKAFVRAVRGAAVTADRRSS
jgi:hypothetical protein